MRALVIDDEGGIRLALAHVLHGRGYDVLEAASGEEGLNLARTFLPDLVFLDHCLPDMDGEELLPSLVAPEVGSRVLMMTGFVELNRAVQAMKRGAEYYFPKPLDLEKVGLILDNLEKDLETRKEQGRLRRLEGEEGEIIGQSPQIIRVQRLIGLLAQNISTPVLILGESGSGKELVAESIHRRSGLSGRFVEINCASLSEALLESELFGHEKGSFTDARKTKKGLFEVADCGTIFFDELAEMPLAIQAKLLKVLDQKTFRRVGGVSDLRSAVRFIGATNRDIVTLVKKGLFREDLYYRINVMPVTVPPLRERGADILALAEHFMHKIGSSMGKARARIAPVAANCLERYHWPGNVRELKNVMERALILSGGREIFPEHLPSEIRQTEAHSAPSGGKLRSLEQVEHDYIDQVLASTGNNHSRTAAILGISRSTLIAKLKKRPVRK